jgi:hypothetical protein
MRRTTRDEDLAILDTIHYRPAALTRSDSTLGACPDVARDDPRARPSGAFIG